MEIGVYTFGEVRGVEPQRRLRDLLEEAELADQVGLDVFGVGEHHRPDFAVSAPAVALAAVAVRTSRIRLTSVLGQDYPTAVGAIHGARPAGVTSMYAAACPCMSTRS